MEALGPGGVALLRLNEAGNELGLKVFEAPLAAVGLDEANDEEDVIGGMEDVEEEAGVAVPPVEQRRMHEREDDAKASGIDDEVDLLGGAVGKVDATTLIFRDVRLGSDGAVSEVIGQLRVDGGMGLGELVVRRLGAKAAEVADGHAIGDAADEAANAQGHAEPQERLADLVHGAAEEELGHVPVAAAGAEEGLASVGGRVGGDVAAGVAG